MATFLMFGKYSGEAVKQISSARTDQAINLIKKFGGGVKAMYALLGETDLVLIVDLPGVEQAMKVSVGLGKLTGISFTTSPAVSVEEFDKLMAEV
ncbi:MAG: GYD domain-containing protein [Deltaproteobacteria bacterium]|nr:GYD domain-containing protein [Deltaproteobacteria bacterium]MBW1951520.1 GYD domain-containing protein [Deltaproteobacteria bacterium]MBW1986456.1 GYD domain-containing protein [Deltaproteobacteria bacterium]MBW2135547.1 GYD domain-containing protein [Deltaproteobacteria bacterium]